ncbi:unnamed protein product, partial [Aureobasidium uvarum]
MNKSAVYNQFITVTDRHGEQNQFPLWYVDTLIVDAVVHGIIPGVQFGASLILFLVLVLLSKHDKRRSPVFIFNTAALFFNIIYALLQCCIVTSSWWDIYPVLVGDYGVVTPAAQRLTTAVAVFVALVALCIEVSLVLQVHVVSITLRMWQKLSILAVSSFVAVVAMGFRIAQSVVSQHDLARKGKRHQLDTEHLLLQRNLLRQTGINIPNVGTNILTATCISLPLTSIWAASHASSPSKAARGNDFHRKFLVDSSTADSTLRKPSDAPQWSPSQTTSQPSARERLGVLNSVDSRSDTSSWTKYSPGPRPTIGVRDVDRDLEMQELKEGD